MKSSRIETIIEMLEPNELTADIGCDHGYTSILAVKQGKARKVIASDVGEGPLRAAMTNIRAEHLSGQISTCLSDGIKNLGRDSHVEALIISGMGGMLIRSILEAGILHNAEYPQAPEINGLRQLVLGAQSDLTELRHFLLEELHYSILLERTAYDDGKYYTLMDVRTSSSDEVYSEEEYDFGKHIPEDNLPLYLEYMEVLKRRNQTAYEASLKGESEQSLKRRKALSVQLDRIEKILEKYRKGQTNE